MSAFDLFWALALPVTFMALLLVGAVFVEHLAPRARRSLRRLERIRRGRHAMARQQAEAEARHAEERRQAAAWIAENCYWHQEPRQ